MKVFNTSEKNIYRCLSRCLDALQVSPAQRGPPIPPQSGSRFSTMVSTSFSPMLSTSVSVSFVSPACLLSVLPTRVKSTNGPHDLGPLSLCLLPLPRINTVLTADTEVEFGGTRLLLGTDNCEGKQAGLGWWGKLACTLGRPGKAWASQAGALE